ncbi:VIT1/CCC1 transporter family protein [Anoxybacillus sp. TBDG-1]
MPYLFFAIFFLILIPIYMRLPFGWTKKGITLLLTVACLLSVFGIVALEQFPLWQAALFLLLLVIASTYLLEQKLGHLFYARIYEHDLIVEDDGEDERKDEQPLIRKEAVEENPKNELQQVDDIDVEWSEGDWQEVEQPVVIEPLKDEYNDTIEPIADMDDVIEPLQNDDIDVDEAFIMQERWDDLLSETSNETSRDEAFESETKEGFDIETLAIVEQPIEQMANERHESETTLQSFVVHTVGEQEMDIIPSIDHALHEQDEGTNIPIIEEVVVYEEQTFQSVYDEKETTAGENTNEPLRILPKPLLKNLLASLYAMRPSLSDAEYEQLIHKHLHPRLHEQDYYTFANVLMEHYVASKQYEKLHLFAKQLYAQYGSYPMIQQQLTHMIHYAEQKMGWKK